VGSHAAAIALYFCSYNFIRIHATLRMTPAMAAGVTERLWEVSDLVALLEVDERRVRKSGVIAISGLRCLGRSPAWHIW